MSSENEVSFPDVAVNREDVPRSVYPPDHVYELKVTKITAKRTSGRNLNETGKGLPSGILAADVSTEIVAPSEVEGVDTQGMRASCYFVLGTETDPDCLDPITRGKGGFKGAFSRFTNLLDVLGIREWNLKSVGELAKDRTFFAAVKVTGGESGFTNVNFIPPDPERPRVIGPINGAFPTKIAAKPTATPTTPAAKGNSKKSTTVVCDDCKDTVELKDFAKHKTTKHPES